MMVSVNFGVKIRDHTFRQMLIAVCRKSGGRLRLIGDYGVSVGELSWDEAFKVAAALTRGAGKFGIDSIEGMRLWIQDDPLPNKHFAELVNSRFVEEDCLR